MVRALLPTPPAEKDSRNLELIIKPDRAGELSLQVLQLWAQAPRVKKIPK